MSIIFIKFNQEDQIKFGRDQIQHKSAGGFVFYEEPRTHKLFIALIQPEKDGPLFIPKGHIKKGETPEQAAVREIKEELGLKISPKIISQLGIESYAFTLDESAAIHQKDVYLYVFDLSEKLEIRAPVEEGIYSAVWVEFHDALSRLAFDKQNLLKARQHFYYDKPVKKYKSLRDISSLTIAIPTHNGAQTITYTLDSVIDRLREIPSHILKEVVICTDHCTDNTLAIIGDYISKEIDGIKLRYIENDGPKGKSSVLNKIFDNSSGDLFCAIDDDVILKKNCLRVLLEELVKNLEIRCVFAAWQRFPFHGHNQWNKFWHWILGIKFDIQPYYKPSKIMRGACMMYRRDNFVRLPPDVLNEDQFIQYVYWPRTSEVSGAIIYFNSVTSLTDYYKRFIRITAGSKIIEKYFTQERIRECVAALYHKIDYRRILSLPWKQKWPFLFYRFIRIFINVFVKIRLKFSNNDYEWFRIRQN